MTGGLEDLRVLKFILYLFEGISEVSINSYKSPLYSSKAQYFPKCSQNPHSELHLLVIYFGVLISRTSPAAKIGYKLNKQSGLVLLLRNYSMSLVY